LSLSPSEGRAKGLPLNADGIRRTAFDVLSYPGIDWDSLASVWPELHEAPVAAREQVTIDAKYAVYISRQEDDLIRLRKDEGIDLSLFDLRGYAEVPGLSRELRSKLDLIRPRSIAQARQIEGMTPAALMLLAAHSRRASQDVA
jgi:tRNA uridine 5-carboxymethylaminomethyl modification enzyme